MNKKIPTVKALFIIITAIIGYSLFSFITYFIFRKNYTINQILVPIFGFFGFVLSIILITFNPRKFIKFVDNSDSGQESFLPKMGYDDSKNDEDIFAP